MCMLGPTPSGSSHGQGGGGIWRQMSVQTRNYGCSTARGTRGTLRVGFSTTLSIRHASSSERHAAQGVHQHSAGGKEFQATFRVWRMAASSTSKMLQMGPALPFAALTRPECASDAATCRWLHSVTSTLTGIVACRYTLIFLYRRGRRVGGDQLGRLGHRGL